MLGLYIEILVAVEDSSISDLLFFTGIPIFYRHPEWYRFYNYERINLKNGLTPFEIRSKAV